MRLFFLLFLCLSIGMQGQSPETLDETYLATKVQYFTFDQAQLKGEGAKTLEKLIKESHFFMLGESHGSAQTSNLTQALIPTLQKNGYQYFACEVGPHSAKKLKQVTTDPNQAQKQLTKFVNEYYFTEIDDVAVPFFENEADAAFLSSISSAKMDIWGLDQEYWSSVFFLLDEMVNSIKDQPHYQQQLSRKNQLIPVAKEWLIKDDNDEQGFKVFAKILEEDITQQFFAGFKPSDQVALEIIDDLKISWDIYNRYREGSHADRLRYMRGNFRKNYEKAKTKEKHPKVFLKMGGFHASKITSLNPDVGREVNNIARSNEQKFTNIYVWRRFFQDNSTTIDLLKKNRRNAPYQLFLSFGMPDQAVLIDLKAVRQDLINGSLIIPDGPFVNRWKDLIYGFDYQIILPADYESPSLFED